MDWTKFILHFIFGLFLGVLVNIGWGIFFDANSWMDLIWLPILIGILGGIYGDRLWHKFIKRFLA
jgi:hypothetical protein